MYICLAQSGVTSSGDCSAVLLGYCAAIALYVSALQKPDRCSSSTAQPSIPIIVVNNMISGFKFGTEIFIQNPTGKHIYKYLHVHTCIN